MKTRTLPKLKLALASTAVIALSLGSAFATAQESSSGSGWTGYYLGLKGGYTWSDSTDVKTRSDNVQVVGYGGSQQGADAAVQAASGNTSVSPSGAIGGGFAGYNWQSGQLVYGVEVDVQLASNKDNGNSSSSVPISGFPANSIASTTSVSQELSFLSTLRGRFGFLTSPDLLIYGTGGLAVGGAKTKANTSQEILGPSGGITTTYQNDENTSETLYGWTAGAGLDWKFMQDYSIKAEYLYYDLGDMDSSRNNFGSDVLSGGSFYTNSIKTKSSYEGSVASIGISYHFQ